MALIQPGHDPVPGTRRAVSSRAALAYGTPAACLAGAVVHGHQLAQHPNRVPLRALGPGLVGLGAVVGRVEQSN